VIFIAPIGNEFRTALPFGCETGRAYALIDEIGFYEFRTFFGQRDERRPPQTRVVLRFFGFVFRRTVRVSDDRNFILLEFIQDFRNSFQNTFVVRRLLRSKSVISFGFCLEVGIIRTEYDFNKKISRILPGI